MISERLWLSASEP